MKIYRQRLFSVIAMIDPSTVSRFLGVLGGFIFKAKVLHWAAKGKDIHEYLDAFWKLLYEFQDAIAEGWMGIGGKFSASEIGFVASESDEPREFIHEVEEKVLDFYELLPDDPRFKGLSGEVEGFIQEIQKYKYLFGLCYGEEEEKRFSIYRDWKAARKSLQEQGELTKKLYENPELSGGTWSGHVNLDYKNKKYKFSKKFEGLNREEGKKMMDELLKEGNRFNNKVALKRAAPYAITTAALGTALGVGIHKANKNKKNNSKKENN